MIWIHNEGAKNKDGETLYTVNINRDKIAEFYHVREEGLVQCLYRAYKAVRKLKGE